MKYKIRFLLALLFIMSLPASADSISSQASKFWVEFRNAVKSEDYQALETMTRFPLAVHGELDFMPVKKIEKEGFAGAFKKLLNQEIYIDKNGQEIRTTMRNVVIETVQIDKKYNLDRDKHFRVSDLEFDYKDNRWALFRTYYPEE